MALCTSKYAGTMGSAKSKNGKQQEGKEKTMIEKDEKKKLITVLIAGSLLSCITAVGTQAFLVKNSAGSRSRFFPGSVNAILTGWEWEPQEGERLTPGETLILSPVIENRGTMDSWVFVKICVPVEEIISIEPNTHKKAERKSTELVTFTVAEDWEQLQRQSQGHQMEYILGYQKKVPYGSVTTPFLNEIQIVNYLEGQLNPKTKYDVSLETIAVQGNVTGDGEGLQEAYQYMTGGERL